SYFAAGGDELEEIFDRYSEALGIAYQIRDDIDDLAADAAGDDGSVRPSLPLAIAFERSHAKEPLRNALRNGWTSSVSTTNREQILGAIRELGADKRCQSLLDAYKQEAIRSLADVDNPSLKGLLRRIVGKIFNELEIKGWCSERQTADAAGR